MWVSHPGAQWKDEEWVFRRSVQTAPTGNCEMPKPDEILRLDKISISFGGLQVLNRVDVRLDQGELLGLIGPNAAGKSNLV
jgi:ATPase subunit of ABC transporter with duplicated ATPase domains